MALLSVSSSTNPFISQNCETLDEAKQFHALSLKTGAFSNSSVSSRLLALYAATKINNLQYARSVFNQIQTPTLVSWNIIIKCYVDNQRSNEGIILFSRLLGEFQPDGFTLPCVIKGCARLSAIEEGKQIHGLVLKIGFGLEKFVQSSLVSMYAKCGQIASARKVFDGMNDRDLVTWNSMIDGLSRSGEVDEAMNLFEQMPEKDQFSWTVLVNGFSKKGRIETARQMFDKMPNRNIVSWNAMINGYMKCGDCHLALELFNQVPTKNQITWNSMIAGFEFNKKFTKVLNWFLLMLEQDVSPNQATILSVLSAVSGLASLSKGRWIHSFIVKNGVEIEGVLGTSLIEMYSKCGCIENALQVFQTISQKKLGHWTAIIVGLGMHGMADHAIQLFLEMCKTGLKPHSITFIGLLNACSHAGLVAEARLYFKIMITYYGIDPAIEHYGCFVDVLCRAGYLEEAKNVIEGMPMEPNKVIWMSLLGGSRKHRNVNLGEYAAKNLIELAPETIGCYVLLSNMYASAGLWEKVSRVRETMKKRGVRKEPGCSSIECRGAVHEFTVGDKSHPQTKEIYSKLSEMREKLKDSGHVPDLSQVLLLIEGEGEKEEELENHSERLAIAFGLINVEAGSPIHVIKNLRICNDCHSVAMLLSQIYDREIVVRDNSRFHHFKNGSCSCKMFW